MHATFRIIIVRRVAGWRGSGGCRLACAISINKYGFCPESNATGMVLRFTPPVYRR